MQPKVPQQHGGVRKNIEEQVSCSTLQQAKELYEKAARRLLQVNRWHEWCGVAGARFALSGADGAPHTGLATKGLWMSIDIPGPGTVAGKGLDWVCIDLVEQSAHGDEAITQMTVHPSPPPDKHGDDTAHFLSPEASSTFVVKQQGNTITATVYGRNEKPNTDTDNVIDTIRNTLVYLGAVAGLSDLQWKSLVKGLLQP